MPSGRTDFINDYFETVDDNDPVIVRIIGSLLISLEHTARELHIELHSGGTFTNCSQSPCLDNNQTLNKIYRDIIAMRKNG